MNPFKIIFEDASFIVIDKPAGLRVDLDPEGLPSVENIFNFPIERHGIVHRLDKETSGVLVVAKTTEALENLKKQFQEHTTNKIYTTLVLGQTDKVGEIRNFLARDPKRKQAMKVINYPTGDERGKLREAITHYRLITNYQLPNYPLSLLEVKIETGRTHQIRVHMQSIGCPIIGDDMYNTKTSKEASSQLGLDRQFLHAASLEFNHPQIGERLKFESPLPLDLQTVLNKLQSQHD